MAGPAGILRSSQLRPGFREPGETGGVLRNLQLQTTTYGTLVDEDLPPGRADDSVRGARNLRGQAGVAQLKIDRRIGSIKRHDNIFAV